MIPPCPISIATGGGGLDMGADVEKFPPTLRMALSRAVSAGFPYLLERARLYSSHLMHGPTPISRKNASDIFFKHFITLALLKTILVLQ